MATGRIVDLWHRKDRTRTSRYGTGKRWQAVWTDNTGKETKRSFDYKDKAQAWLDSKTTDRTLNPHGLKADMLFMEFWDKWREQQTHQRASSLRMTDSADRKRILPTFEGKYLTEIKREDIQAAINGWVG
ncbi:N-terminal phage integrase SAM-like domain-containing protein [Glutamicibacter mysorens]|uniref:N-terminal phage integrase SAM-like domain-containing protein n=1 Tax=Glutamicibacter mysorens TaxID=257984 RepID=UPI0020C6FC45|nr:N-terminal phage integrase SAM-like domain-containing protein [Glutamicibacter mysorens]UTM47236.1 N-terminal phage integrase SAM-like domain-containing protein [Glutamicibacter mysorens]